jgi:DNA-binding SARP family transcriptional activator
MERIMALAEGWTPVMVMVGEMLSHEQYGPEFLDIEAAFLLKKIPLLSLYLEQECFNHLSPEQQNVLMATSIVEKIPADLANVLAGEGGAAVIQDLIAMNMLVYPVEGEFGTVRLHSLWKSFLMRKAGERWDRNGIHELHRKAGDYFFALRNWKSAIYHFVQGEDLERSIEVLKRFRPEVLEYKLADQLHSLIIKSSLEKKEYDPWLSFALACSVRYRDPVLWSHYLQQALEGFRKINDAVGEMYALSQSIDVLMWLGEFRQMETFLADQSSRTDLNEITDLKIIGQRNFYVAMANCFFTGNLNEAVRAGEEARKIAFILKDDHLRIWAAWILAHAHWFIGNFDMAHKRLKEAFEKLNSPEADDFAAVHIPYMAGLIANFTGEFTTARSYLADAQARAQKLGMEAKIFYIKNFACYAALYLGDFGSCEKLLNEMGDIIGTCMTGENDHIMAYYWTWRGHYMYVRGQYHEAAALAGQALKLREKTGGEMYLIKCLLVLGGALRESGKLHDSEHYLQEALSRSIATGSIFLQASCHLQLALLYDLLNHKELFAEKSYYHFFMWRDDHMARIIPQAKNQGDHETYITELCRRRLSSPDIIPEDNRTKPLKVSILGSLMIDVNGAKQVNFGLRKPLYLLALLAAKAFPVSVEVVIDEMWPEMNINSARNNFYFTLNRLRNVLGNHDFIILKDGLCSLNPDKVWTDIGQFKSLCEKAAKFIDLNQIFKAINLLEEAFTIYRGDFLEGESLGPLLTVEREVMAKKSFDSLVLLGRLLMQTGEYEEALKILSKVSSNPFADENLSRLLMLAHYTLCNPGQALKIYNKLEKILASEFQTSPHRKTKELRDLIRGGTNQPVSDLIKWMSHEDL